jgi:hypothetical protein
MLSPESQFGDSTKDMKKDLRRGTAPNNHDTFPDEGNGIVPASGLKAIPPKGGYSRCRSRGWSLDGPERAGRQRECSYNDEVK